MKAVIKFPDDRNVFDAVFNFLPQILTEEHRHLGIVETPLRGGFFLLQLQRWYQDHHNTFVVKVVAQLHIAGSFGEHVSVVIIKECQHTDELLDKIAASSDQKGAVTAAFLPLQNT